MRLNMLWGSEKRLCAEVCDSSRTF